MLEKTQGIVLKHVKYSETSIICKIFTETLGLRSYIINGVRSSKSRNQIVYFQSLSLLDLVVYEREGKNVQRIKESKPAFIFSELPFDIVKSSLAVFITEILDKSLKEEQGNTELFTFLDSTIRFLDQTDARLVNFPIWFLLELSKSFGFQPDSLNYTEGKAFNLKEGNFEPISEATYQISPHISAYLYAFLGKNLEDSLNVHISRPDRRLLLDTLLRFYAYHMENFGEVQSLEVLRIVLD